MEAANNLGEFTQNLMNTVYKLFCLLFIPIAAHALYFGNPSAPDMIEEGFFFCSENWGSIKLGYEGDYCFDRKLRSKDGVEGRIDKFSYLMNQGVVTFNILDLMEIYGSVGAMNAFISHRPEPNHEQREYQTSDRLTWGGGTKIELFHWGATTVSADGKYQYSHPHVKWNSLNGVAYTTGAKLTYREYQAGMGLSHRIDMFVPYVAVYYSHVKGKLYGIRQNILPVSHFSLQCREWIGMAVGCGFSSSCLFDLNIEARMFNQSAVSVSANIKF